MRHHRHLALRESAPPLDLGALAAHLWTGCLVLLGGIAAGFALIAPPALASPALDLGAAGLPRGLRADRVRLAARRRRRIASATATASASTGGSKTTTAAARAPAAPATT